MVVRLACLLLALRIANAATASPLFARGYAVLPPPQRYLLTERDFAWHPDWNLVLNNVPKDSAAVEAIAGRVTTGTNLLTLEIAPGAVAPERASDGDSPAINAQAYSLVLKPTNIQLRANAEAGLFYGVETFLQLASSGRLPEGIITDWPNRPLRHIYWDDAHHLEKLSELKRAVRQAASFKINGFVLKLEGHFQYRSAPALVEPQALAPEQFQELTNYGLRYHVQVIPYLDAPSHIAFILKHPEYAPLRAFPASNYELCTTKPESIKLLQGMYDDLLAANQGVKYFYLSTDEAYYAGLSDQNGCQEAQRSKEWGSVGKVLAEFITTTANYLHERGRTVMFWGEYPLKTADIASLPSHLINGETYGPAFDKAFRQHGIRQMLYNATEGEERLFPHYFLRPPAERLHPLYEDYERVPAALHALANDPARENSDLTGTVIAGWGDMGLHPETFWLGYATLSAIGWNSSMDSPQEAMNTFYPLFYGAHSLSMSRIYQLLSHQAEIWTDSWETVDSTWRTPIWGDSYQIFKTPKPAHDQSIDLPSSSANWTEAHRPLLQMVERALTQNTELEGLLGNAILAAPENRYNLEVFLSISRLCRQNLEFLNGLSQIDQHLRNAAKAAVSAKPKDALSAFDKALAEAIHLRQSRNAVLADATATWYKSWLPRVKEANGRIFLHQVDDVKDHLPDRTIDMSYLVYRELQLPFDAWFDATLQTRNRWAAAHSLPLSKAELAWKALQ